MTCVDAVALNRGDIWSRLAVNHEHRRLWLDPGRPRQHAHPAPFRCIHELLQLSWVTRFSRLRTLRVQLVAFLHGHDTLQAQFGCVLLTNMLASFSWHTIPL